MCQRELVDARCEIVLLLLLLAMIESRLSLFRLLCRLLFVFQQFTELERLTVCVVVRIRICAGLLSWSARQIECHESIEEIRTEEITVLLTMKSECDLRDASGTRLRNQM